MKLKKSDVPKNLPLRVQVDSADFLGAGKDNSVFTLRRAGHLAVDRERKDFVVKVNHKVSEVEARRLAETGADRVKAENGIKYKKNKYDILKHFLGDFIPNSTFVLTQEGHGSKKRYVEMTLQQQVPQTKLSDLTPEQRANPILKRNMSTLLQRLQYMFRVLGETNARVAQPSQLDAKLDLGGISDAVRGEELDHVFSAPEVETLIGANKSPNLLVNPDTLQLYCIDFDQGQWNEGMSYAKELAYGIDGRVRREHAAEQLGPLMIPPLMEAQNHN